VFRSQLQCLLVSSIVISVHVSASVTGKSKQLM